MYNRCNTSRIAMAFAFCLGFSAVGVRWAAAQAAPREPASPRLPSTVVQQPSPEASPITAAKPSAVRTVRPAVPSQVQAAKEPEQMKIVRVFRGDGHFDAAMAEKLRPVLEQTFSVRPANVASDLVRSMFGQNEDQKGNTNQNRVTNTGQPSDTRSGRARTRVRHWSKCRS